MFYITVFMASILGAFLCWDTSARIWAIVGAVIAYAIFFTTKRFFPLASEVPKQIFVAALVILASAIGFIVFGLATSLSPGATSGAQAVMGA